jgi:nonribosomal peptide synthetase MxcG
MGIKQAAVVVRKSRGHSRFLAAFVVSSRADSYAVDSSVIRQHLSKVLPAAMVPSCIVFVEQLPKTASGKIDRKQLKSWPIDQQNPSEQIQLTPMQAIIAEVWQEILGVAQVQPHHDFFALGGQSLQTIQVANRLSARLENDVPVATLFRYPSLEGLALAIEGKTAQVVDFLDDARELAQRVWEKPLAASQRQPTTRLLTGATGFVGIWLLKSLLEQTSDDITCLIRAGSLKEAQTKLEQAAAKQRLTLPEPQRIRIVVADLAAPNLGLNEDDYQALVRQSIEIYHNAASTSVMRDYASLRETNVLSTLTLLQIAAKAGCTLHFVSTIAVAPPANEADALGESVVAAHSGLIDGYQQSKWVAETLVNQARTQGVATRIYRLGRVVGALGGETYVNPTDLVWTILAAAMRQRTLPDLAFSEPWTPVDSVAYTMTRMALAEKGPQIANLIPSNWVSMTQIMDWLQQEIGELPVVGMVDWCKQLARSSVAEDNTLYHFFEQRKDGVAKLARIDRGLTARAMDTLAIYWPQISRAQFRDYLAYALEHKLVALSESEDVALEASHDR